MGGADLGCYKPGRPAEFTLTQRYEKCDLDVDPLDTVQHHLT
jgi:hypothetical protein